MPKGPPTGETPSGASRDIAIEDLADAIVETIHEPLIVLYDDLRVKSVNPAFYSTFAVEERDTIGRKIYDLGNGQWNIPKLRELLEDVLPTNNVFNDFEVTHTFDEIGERVMLVNARRLDHVQLILLGIRDITEQSKARRRLETDEAHFRSIADAMPQLV